MYEIPKITHIKMVVQNSEGSVSEIEFPNGALRVVLSTEWEDAAKEGVWSNISTVKAPKIEALVIRVERPYSGEAGHQVFYTVPRPMEGKDTNVSCL